MLVRLILLFTLIPVAEIALLIQIGRYIGTLPTIGLVLATGVIGAYLAKQQGLAVIDRIRVNLDQGILPGDDIANGICILAGGILLVTPGILTDITGLLMVLPATRDVFKRYFIRRIKQAMLQGDVRFKIL